MASSLGIWQQRIRDHYSQNADTESDSKWASGDFWRPLMANFKVDPHRVDDPSLNRLKEIVNADATVIDVGGGAGRFALPLSFHCNHVTVVEPADSMVEVLRESLQEENIENVSVMQEPWEDAKVEPADIVLSAFSVYGVIDVEPFIRKLEANAKELVIMLVLVDQPQSQFSSLWKSTFGEERADLPALTEIMNVLWELEIYPDIEMLEPTEPQMFDNREIALERARHSLSVDRDSSEYFKLQEVLDDHLVQSSRKLMIKGARPRRLGMITWTPTRI